MKDGFIGFYPYDIDSVIDGENRGVIRLFGKTEDGKKVVVFDRNFNAYFYVIPKRYSEELRKKIEEVRVDKENRSYFVVKAEKEKRKYLGEGVESIKVTVNSPNGIDNIVEIVKKMKDVEGEKEIDIPLYKRYLIDKNITPLNLCKVNGEIRKPDKNYGVDLIIDADEIKPSDGEFDKAKILAFDIEAYAPEDKYARADKEPVVMISLYSDNFKKVITWKRFKTDLKYIEFVGSEKELIDEFKRIVKKINPDYLVGYFSDGFDLPYLAERAKKYKIRLDLGVDNSNIIIRNVREGSSCKIKGIVHLDIFKFIYKTMSNDLQTDSLDLNSVAEELIGKGKKEVDIGKLGKVWDRGGKDLEKFCEYNLNDSIITYEIFEKVLPNLNELTRLVGQPIYDVCRMSYGQLVENYLLKRVKEFDEIYPNRPGFEKIRERISGRYQGAFVFEPKPGLYKNLVVFDFKSLYPTILVAYNICPSTLSEKKGGYSSPEILIGKKKVKYYFSGEKKGFFPEIVKELIIRRDRIKTIIKKEKKSVYLSGRSYALKILANSIYGYLGFFGARWYSKECAESITAFARKHIMDLIEEAQKEKFHVVYSDTDSLYITLDDKNKKDALDFLKYINKNLPELMELELEGFFPRGIFVAKKSERGGAKKKYALLDEEGNIIIKGFESIRRNSSLIAKEVQKKVFELVLKDGSKEKAMKYVQDIIEDIKKKRIDLSKMIIQTQLQKGLSSYENVGPHVTIAKRMKEKGIEVGPGSIIRYVVVGNKGKIRDRVKLVNECKGNDYDADYYINNQILPAVNRIFEALDIDEKELVNTDQRKLGDF